MICSYAQLFTCADRSRLAPFQPHPTAWCVHGITAERHSSCGTGDGQRWWDVSQPQTLQVPSSIQPACHYSTAAHRAKEPRFTSLSARYSRCASSSVGGKTGLCTRCRLDRAPLPGAWPRKVANREPQQMGRTFPFAERAYLRGVSSGQESSGCVIGSMESSPKLRTPEERT